MTDSSTKTTTIVTKDM